MRILVQMVLERHLIIISDDRLFHSSPEEDEEAQYEMCI